MAASYENCSWLKPAVLEGGYFDDAHLSKKDVLEKLDWNDKNLLTWHEPHHLGEASHAHHYRRTNEIRRGKKIEEWEVWVYQGTDIVYPDLSLQQEQLNELARRKRHE